MSFIAALDAELEALHNALAADPTFVKWRELQRIRGLYSQVSADVVLSGPSGMTVVQVKPMPVQQSPSRGEVDAGPRGRRPDPSRSRAVQEAETIIRAANGDPVPTADILEQLQEQGTVIPGERPLNNLSAMLSNSGMFTANGRRGWTLKIDESDQNSIDTEPEDELTRTERQEGEDDDRIDRIVAIKQTAETVGSTLDQGMKDFLRRVVTRGGHLPEDIEQNLSRTATLMLKRVADDIEMRLIRNEFLKILHRNANERSNEVV